MALLQGSMVRVMSLSTIPSNWARVIFKLRCFGPVASMVRKGMLMSVWVELESSILAFSAASLIRWVALDMMKFLI